MILSTMDGSTRESKTMTAGTSILYVLMRALCHRAAVLTVVTAVSIAACSLESTLDSLGNQFPRHKSELSSLVSVLQALHAEVSLNGYTRYSESPPTVRIGNSQERIPLAVAQERLPKSSDHLIRLAKLAENLKLDYLSVQFGEYFVITMKGGGTLGGDIGYVYTQKGNLPGGVVKYFKPIPGESYWYAFAG